MYEPWLWIELIGFDNESPDCGVSAFLDNMGFTPRAISLLMYTPDFVHRHEGLHEEKVLPPDQCSYRGRPHSRERARQAWTNHQVKRLVEALHEHGVQVYCSFFNLFVSVIDGREFRSEWTNAHPEIWETRRTGEPIAAVCPLKRLADGSYYEDLFVPQLVRVLRDYGFDGYHGADGYTCTRRPIYDVDFSDDMIEQFVEASGALLPEGSVATRADYIWRNLRLEWIGFYADRWQRFWRKVVSALHAEGKQAVFNSAWTRDPLQALYRYGLDYRKIADTGIDGFVVETVGTGVSTGAEGAETNAHYDFLAMLMLMKAYTPEVPLRCLNGTHDTTEQWDTLSHAPTMLEREMLSISNLYRLPGAQRCSSGPVVCLSDSIRGSEWQWLKRRWDLGFSLTPRRVLGATLVWSDRALHPELADFIRTRRWSTHKWVYELTARGASIHTVARIEDLPSLTGAILVANADLLSGDELQSVLTYEGGPVIQVGAEPEANLSPADLPNDVLAIEDPLSFVDELRFRGVSPSYLDECVQRIIDAAQAPLVLSEGHRIRVWAVEAEDGTLRLFIGNDAHFYVAPEIDVRRDIASIRVATEFPGMPIEPYGSRFRVRVPPRGIVVLDVALAAG